MVVKFKICFIITFIFSSLGSFAQTLLAQPMEEYPMPIEEYSLKEQTFESEIASKSELQIDEVYKKIYDSAGNEISKPDDSTVIIRSDVIATINKTNIYPISTYKSNSAVYLSNEISSGALTLPEAQLGIMPYRPAAGDSYSLIKYANYLNSLSDEDLLNALKYNMVGQCKLINKSYLPSTIGANFPASLMLYVPNAKTQSYTFSSKLKPIPGSIRLNGTTIGCLHNYPAGACSSPTLKSKTISLLRFYIKQSISGIDRCDIASTVASLNSLSSPAPLTIDELTTSSNMHIRLDSSDKIRCFMNLRNPGLVPSTRHVTIAGQQTVEIDNKICKLAIYRELRVFQKTAEIEDIKQHTVLDKITKLTATEESQMFLATVGKDEPVDIESQHILNHTKYVADHSSLLSAATEANLKDIGQVPLEEIHSGDLGLINVVFNGETTTKTINEYDTIEQSLQTLEEATTAPIIAEPIGSGGGGSGGGGSTTISGGDPTVIDDAPAATSMH